MKKNIVPSHSSNVINRHAPEIQEQLADTINEALHVHPSLATYALIDTAFSETCISRYKKMHANTHVMSLYAGTELNELTDVSPCLVQLPSDPSLRKQGLATLLRLTNGKPMISVLLSAFDLESLKAHFSAFLQAETEDGQRFVLRFADTRILPVLIATLDQEPLAYLLSPIVHWLTIDRMGKLNRLLPLDDELHNTQVTPPFSALPLSANQFSTLLDAAEPDAIIEHLQLIAPEHCSTFAPGSLHQFVDEQLQHATHFGVTGTPDRIAYCIGAFNINGKLHEDRHAKALFTEKRWQPGDLANALAELPDECWQMEAA